MKLDLLDIYSDYLTNQSHYAAPTSLANMFQSKINHYQMTRHLRSKDYSSSNLSCCVKVKVRKKQSSDCILIIDDTICEKSYTDEDLINYWHFSHSNHRYVKGINLLSCEVISRDPKMKGTELKINSFRLENLKPKYSVFNYLDVNEISS